MWLLSLQEQQQLDAKGVAGPGARSANAAYPRLETLSRPAELDRVSSRGAPDLSIFNMELQPNKRGECFPFLYAQDWGPFMGYDFLVPCHEDPAKDFVVLTGLTGRPCPCKLSCTGDPQSEGCS